MNITDYLVEYLKQGNQVNIPQVGLLAEKEVEAHFDQSSATFYPKQRTLSIEPSNQQESAFIQFLAQKECVSTGTATQIWKNYKVLDETGEVDDLDVKTNVNALTNLIQIVRYAYKKNQKLTSLIKGYAQRFSLYCGQAQRVLTDDQKEIMRQIAEFVINDGAISVMELNEIDTDLWRRGVISFTAPVLAEEMQTMSRFLLRAA